MDPNKNLKLVIIVTAVLLMAGSVFYYYVIFLPRSVDREFQAQREEKCIELVNNERSKKENELGEQISEFKYKYDRETDSCFIYFRQLDNCIQDTCRTYETIRNLFTGETIDEFSYRASEFSDPETIDRFNEFDKKIEQIFGK